MGNIFIVKIIYLTINSIKNNERYHLKFFRLILTFINKNAIYINVYIY